MRPLFLWGFSKWTFSYKQIISRHPFRPLLQSSVQLNIVYLLGNPEETLADESLLYMVFYVDWEDLKDEYFPENLPAFANFDF